MRVYATPQDLAASPWNLTLDAPQAEALLRRATYRVEDLLASAIYTVDQATGLPQDEPVAHAIRDAVCAYAVWLDEMGDTSGAASQYSSLKLGSFAAALSTPHGENPERTSPEAVAILRGAGLLSGAMVVS